MQKPPLLQPGDRVAVIAPASGYDENALKQGMNVLSSWGLKVDGPRMAPNKFSYLADNDRNRLQSLHQAFENPQIKAIFCARGGYGVLRILEEVDWALIHKHPKIFVGYSDLTPILNQIVQTSQLVCFHGPVVAKDLDAKQRPKTAAALRSVLMDARMPDGTDFGTELSCVVQGQAQGILVGGNLSLLCSTLGTKFALQPKGNILFLEEVNERPYRIDRLLQQLRLAGIFESVAGVLLGSFAVAPEDEDELSRLFEDFFSNLKVPVLKGLPAGHGEEKLTLPMGTPLQMDSKRCTLSWLEESFC